MNEEKITGTEKEFLNVFKQLCISRSWETESEQDLNTEHLQEVAKIRKKYGTKKAVEKVWKLLRLK